MASQASIRLCGSVAVELDGRPVHTRIRHGNELLLFAYLALERGRPVPREEAAVALWPDRRPVHEDAALRTVLSRLRWAVGRDLLIGGPSLVLRLPADTRFDVVDAQEAVGAARRCTDPRHALDLVAPARQVTEQPLLPGLDTPWIEARRRDLADLWLDAIEIEARASVELGDTAGAVDVARRLVERVPLHETGTELLMRALARQGNVADALGVYEGLRRRLRDELGTAPGPALRALHAALLAGGTADQTERPVALTAAELLDVAWSLVATPDSWRHLVRHDPAQRVFEAVPAPAGVEAWVICWMPGHDSGLHDHDISSGAIAVVDGELIEERLTWGGTPESTRYGPGTSFTFGPSDIHRVVHAGTAPATTIHTYSPPLRNQGVYARGSHDLLQRHPLAQGAEVRPLP